MADLNKTDASAAITERLAIVKDNLKKLDKLVGKAEQLEAELAKLKSDEMAILKDSRDDEAKLPELLHIRGAIDLKQATVDSFRGEKSSRGNNVAKEQGSIEVAEKAVHDAGDDVARFFNAFYDATKVRLKEAIQEATKSFIRPEDGDELMNLASRHPNVKQLHFFNLPIFHKGHITGYTEDVRVARNLDNVWADLLASADAIGGELAVSIPDPWLD
jgi:hypothetical protein